MWKSLCLLPFYPLTVLPSSLVTAAFYRFTVYTVATGRLCLLPFYPFTILPSSLVTAAFYPFYRFTVAPGHLFLLPFYRFTVLRARFLTGAPVSKRTTATTAQKISVKPSLSEPSSPQACTISVLVWHARSAEIVLRHHDQIWESACICWDKADSSCERACARRWWDKHSWYARARLLGKIVESLANASFRIQALLKCRRIWLIVAFARSPLLAARAARTLTVPTRRTY